MKKTVKILLTAMLAFQFLGHAQNTSLNFDGTDDLVELPKNEGVLGKNFTIEAWFKTTQTPKPQTIFLGFFDPQTITGAGRHRGPDQRAFAVFFRPLANSPTYEELYSNKKINDGAWHHFAYVQEDTRILKMYIDGVLDNVLCMNQVKIEAPILIELGQNRYASGDGFRHFLGNIDDLKIWSIAKGGPRVFDEFKREHEGTEAGLFSNYKFDEASDTIFDCSELKNHGLRSGNAGSNLGPQFSNDKPALVDVGCAFMFVGTDEEFAQKTGQIQLFPNPATQEVTISLKSSKTADVQIFGIDGKLLMQFKIFDGLKSVSIAPLPVGVYELRVVSVDGASAIKLVKN